MAAKRTVRIGYARYPGLHEQKADGNLSGYGYDFYQRLAKYADWDIQFVGYERNWEDMMLMLEKGEIDLIGFVAKNDPSRRDKFLFSKRPVVYTGTSIRTARNNLHKYNLQHVENWPKCRVGVLRGDDSYRNLNLFCNDHGIEHEIIEYTSEEVAAEACKRGELDLVAFDELAPYFGLAPVGDIARMSNHVCVRKSDAALMQEVDSAMDSLAKSEVRWMSNLYRKYYPVTDITAYFPANLDPRTVTYLRTMLVQLSEIIGWDVSAVPCSSDFKDAKLDANSLGCGLFFSSEGAGKFDMPLLSVGRRRADLYARPEDLRFTKGISNLSMSYRVGCLRHDAEALRTFTEYASAKGIAYRLYGFDSEELMVSELNQQSVDLILLPSEPRKNLKQVAACGYVEFFIATPNGQSRHSRELEEALKFLRLNDPDFFLRLEKLCYSTDDDDDRHVRVAAYLERGLCSRNDKGEWVGLVPDLVNEIAMRQDWNLSYVPMSYLEAQRAMAEGLVDVMGVVVRTPEREKQYDFTRFDTGPLVYALKQRPGGKMREGDPDTWMGTTIGVLRGSKSADDLRAFLSARGVGCTIRKFNDLAEAESAVRRRELDAVLTLSTPENNDLVPLAEVPTSLCFFCANPRKPWVLKGLDGQVDSLVRQNATWLRDLVSKHLTANTGAFPMTPSELEFIRESNGRIFTVSVDHGEPPLSFDGSNPNGFYLRLFNRFAERTQLHFKMLPPGSPADIVIALHGAGKFDPSMITDAQWLNSPACWVKPLSPEVKSPGVIAIMENQPITEKFAKHSGSKVLAFKTREEAYAAVADGRAEKMIDKHAVARYLLDQVEKYPKLSYQRIQTELFTMPVALKVRSDIDSRLHSILDKVRSSISGSEYDNMLFESIYDEKVSAVSAQTMVVTLLVIALSMIVIVTWLWFIIRRGHKINAEKTRFLNSMSHDIRTPMNAIIGFSTMARNVIDEPEKVRECLQKIDVAGGHLLSLINEVLDMSRIESGTVEFHNEPCDLLAHFDKVRVLFSETARKKGLEFTVDTSKMKPQWALCDEIRMNQIVLNIVGNAIKYTKVGSVKVDCEERPAKKGFVTFAIIVADTGVGMSQEFLQKVYDPFARERNTSGAEGTGLGMSIVRKMIDLIGGTINIESTPGLGTKVTMGFTFPVCEPQEAKDNAADEFEFGTDSTRKSLDLRRVLLVEDNELNREIAKFMLEGMKLVVDEAVNGKEGVEKLREKHPGYYDWVLMDIQMPVMNGYEATKEIRKFDKSIPIIAMTANAFSEDRAAAFDAGMNDHIAKPIKADILEASLRKFI